jgi:4-hydroxyphenylpyruvate 3-dimethylallyltransferase
VNGAGTLPSPTEQFSTSVFLQDIERTAAAIQAPYSDAATRAAVAAYTSSFHKGAVLWRATSRPGDALNYRFYERQPSDTIGAAIKAGLLDPDSMAVRLASGWSSLYQNSTELCDFDSEVGLCKTWIYLGGMRPLGEILDAPVVPEAARRRHSQLQDLGLAVVRHVAVDHLHGTMNVYFAVRGPITEAKCRQFVSLAHGDQPSLSVFADMNRYMAPRRFTFSVTANIDDGAIERVGFYALRLPEGEFPAIGPRLTEFFAIAPSRDDEEMNAVAWSFGRDGSNYIKAERSYTGRLVQLMREWNSPMTVVSADTQAAAQ